MHTISLMIRIDAPADKVFHALTSNQHIAGWFTATQCADWSQGSKVVWFDSTDMVITEFAQDNALTLHVNSGGGWDETDIRFSIAAGPEEDPAKTGVRFDHSGWPQVSDHFRDCAMSWAYFLESLCLYLETGKGTPEGVAPACESEVSN